MFSYANCICGLPIATAHRSARLPSFNDAICVNTPASAAKVISRSGLLHRHMPRIARQPKRIQGSNRPVHPAAAALAPGNRLKSSKNAARPNRLSQQFHLSSTSGPATNRTPSHSNGPLHHMQFQASGMCSKSASSPQIHYANARRIHRKCFFTPIHRHRVRCLKVYWPAKSSNPRM